MGYLGVIVIPYLLTIYIHLLTSWDIQLAMKKMALLSMKYRFLNTDPYWFNPHITG